MFRRFYKDAFNRWPTTLREDFCAAFAVCVEWVQRDAEATAVGFDLDPEPLDYGRQHHLPAMSAEQQARLTLLQQDVLETKTKAEVIAAQNYSFFLFKKREEVLRYVKSVKRSLADEGIFVFDMMGDSAFHQADLQEARKVARRTPQAKRDNPPFRYVWHQETFNPITADALFHMHFRFPDGSALQRAFTYDWRLWTLLELRELLDEAGFSETHVYWENLTKTAIRRATTAAPPTGGPTPPGSATSSPSPEDRSQRCWLNVPAPAGADASRQRPRTAAQALASQWRRHDGAR